MNNFHENSVCDRGKEVVIEEHMTRACRMQSVYEGKEGPEVDASMINVSQPFGSVNILENNCSEAKSAAFMGLEHGKSSLDLNLSNEGAGASENLTGEELVIPDAIPEEEELCVTEKQPIDSCSEDCNRHAADNLEDTCSGLLLIILVAAFSSVVDKLNDRAIDSVTDLDGANEMGKETIYGDHGGSSGGRNAVLGKEREELGSEQRKLERNAESVSNEMFAECQELLQMFGLPYIIAQMEAEAQCAFMEQSNLVDGVVTDDSDAFLFGARSVYKNIFDDRKYVETYLMKDIENELGLDREKLIHMALLLGSDYTEGISGIGIVNAIEVVNAFPEKDGLREFREWIESPDPTILGKLDVDAGGTSRRKGSKGSQSMMGGSSSNGEGMSCDQSAPQPVDEAKRIKQIFMDKHRNVSKNWHIPSTFPSDAVILAYASPQVDKSTDPFSWGKPDHFVLRKTLEGNFEIESSCGLITQTPERNEIPEDVSFHGWLNAFVKLKRWMFSNMAASFFLALEGLVFRKNGKYDKVFACRLCWEKFGWGTSKSDELLLPVLKEYNKHETQLRLEAFYTFNERFAKIRSKRIKKAVKGITGAKSSDLMDDTTPQSGSGKKRKVRPSENEANQSGGGSEGLDGCGTSDNTMKKTTVRRLKRQTKEKTLQMNLEQSTSLDNHLLTRKESHIRGRQRGHLSGKGRRKKRNSSAEDAGTGSDDGSYSGSDEEKQLDISEESFQVRRSGRIRKIVNYTVSDVFDDCEEESPNCLKEGNDVGMGSRVCVDETEQTSKMDEMRTSQFSDSQIGDPFKESHLSKDYLQFGGGFCVEEDEEEELNGHASCPPKEVIPEKPDGLNSVDSVMEENHGSDGLIITPRPSYGKKTDSSDTELIMDDKRQSDHISSDDGTKKDPGISLPKSLRAMPNLRRKKRKIEMEKE
ncbi:UNVERIFIED_CONTAM: DNA repair protein UVH3 [Sesamum latifolium]|uniref:DNA repair protein UVH3 n=1 Tax=Sesamum latifolium TaxID=2727402 RepID=A0AAW2S3B9_9LAMI